MQAFDHILAKGIIVESVAVFLEMGLLTKAGFEDWRFGRIPYLERTMACGLPKCKKVVKLIEFHAHDLDMVPRPTVYRKWGKGNKFDLRFTKNGIPALETQYLRCFKWNRKMTYLEWKELENHGEIYRTTA